MKKELKTLDATPSKRLFHSIIADYELNKSICELVDNGLDVWVRGGRASQITILITLDTIQQTITVEDNAGGFKESELPYLVAPGQTGTSPTDETIGIFGVGTKRAVVALAQDIHIKTRHGQGKTFQVDIDDKWIEDEDWTLPVYEIDKLTEGTTLVELQRLRQPLTEELVKQLQDHLSTTYARFLRDQKVTLKLNDVRLTPIVFENWAFPPKYPPQRFNFTLPTPENRKIRVEAIAGLALESSPAAGEYGVYFYCNDRLIARALKTFEVGFMKGLAGLPHPKVSLTRVLVFLNGDARAMPWNSSKSDISTKHEVFRALHPWLTQVVKDYAALSRIWTGDWDDKVFQHTTGKIEDAPCKDIPTVTKSFLPPLPRSRPRYGEIVVQKNSKIAKKKPWTKGIYEGIISADLISKQHLEQRNRIALIVLDSTLEIAFKEYLVNESGAVYNDQKLLAIFARRDLVQAEVQKYTLQQKKALWKKIDHYYRLRCKLVHERVTVGVSDDQIADFRETVELVLRKLFRLKF